MHESYMYYGDIMAESFYRNLSAEVTRREKQWSIPAGSYPIVSLTLSTDGKSGQLLKGVKKYMSVNPDVKVIYMSVTKESQRVVIVYTHTSEVRSATNLCVTEVVSLLSHIPCDVQVLTCDGFCLEVDVRVIVYLNTCIYKHMQYTAATKLNTTGKIAHITTTPEWQCLDDKVKYGHLCVRRNESIVVLHQLISLVKVDRSIAEVLGTP